VTALIVHADGASRGNPGDAAGGAVVTLAESGSVVAEVGVMCGVATNNVAEYRGMISGVQAAKNFSPTHIDIRLGLQTCRRANVWALESQTPRYAGSW
jgi:ribonuclease HI